MKENENKEHSNMECSNDYLRLSEKEISEVWDSMPGQPNGFYKSFGYSQFAHAIEDKVASRCRAQGGNTNTEIIGSAVSTAVGEPVPVDVRRAVDRMCQPLDPSRLDGATAAEDARCMSIIKGFIDRLAAPTQAKPVDLSGLTRYDSFETDEGDELRVEPTGCWVQFDDVERLLAAPTQVSAPQALPDILFDGSAVYDEVLTRSSRTSAENVADVLDAVVRLIRRGAPQASAAQEVRAVPGRALDNLGGAIKMAVNMLSRDGTPVRIEAAGALLAAFGEVAEQAVTSTSTAPAGMDEKGGAK